MGDMNPEKLEAIKMKSGGKVSRVNEAGNYTKPGLRKSIFERIKAGGKGGAPGQWSARKAQMMAQQYTKSWRRVQRLKAPQKSLKDWGDQKWRTKSGKPSTQGPKATGERYLPEKAIKALSPAEYASTTKAKRAGKATGKQFVKQPGSIAKKTARFR
jgi:hypothetical protein